MAAVVNEAQPVAHGLGENMQAVLLGVTGQVGLIVGDDRQMAHAPQQHTADREQGGAEHVDEVRVEFLKAAGDRRAGQGHTRFRRHDEA